MEIDLEHKKRILFIYIRTVPSTGNSYRYRYHVFIFTKGQISFLYPTVRTGSALQSRNQCYLEINKVTLKIVIIQDWSLVRLKPN